MRLKMGTAYIFNEHLDGIDRATIEDAVRTAGYEPVCGVPSDVSSLDPETDIGVVGLPVAQEDEAAVNAGTREFAGAGIRIVSIWLHEEEEGSNGVPEGIGKYGSATVDIGSPELTGALKGEDEVWEEPGGAPRPAPKTKRNKC